MSDIKEDIDVISDYLDIKCGNTDRFINIGGIFFKKEVVKEPKCHK